MSPPQAQPQEGSRELERARVERELRARLFGRAGEPTRVDRFEIRSRLGEGAMGVVYLAFDPRLEREVALKLLVHAELGRPEQFFHEARALARLSHPFVLSVHEAGVHGKTPYLVSEYVDAGTLRAWWSSPAAPRRTSETLGVLLDVARGLQAAHERGIVHRDVKPENVLVGRDGRPRVSDFGLASVPDPAALYRSGDTSPVGTVRYMSPEQLRGEGADAQSDQFSFAVMAHEALFGMLPFQGETREAWAHAIETRSFAEPPRGHPARHLLAPLRRALSAAPAGRFSGMAALIAELVRAAGTTRRRVVWAIGLGGFVAAGVLVALAVRSGGNPGGFRDEDEAAAHTKAARLLYANDPKGCAALLAPFTRSAALVTLRAQCLFQARDAKGLAALCKAARSGSEIDECEPSILLAIADYDAKRWADCVTHIERGTRPAKSNLVLVECVKQWGTKEAYYRQCLILTRDDVEQCKPMKPK